MTSDTTEMVVNSRFYNDASSCLEAMNADLNTKYDFFEVTKVKEAVVSINEQNPLFTNPPEAIEEFKAEHPEFEEYLDTWGEQEVARITFTTEEFEEDEPPIITEDDALLFRYTMHVFEDDMEVPDGSNIIYTASSAIH